jgi:N-methylhydantoinase A
MRHARKIRIGIDVGGTFTDVIGLDDETGSITVCKTHTTPEELSQGVIEGIEKLLGVAKLGSELVRILIHGTTIGTNALIERKGAKTALLTTEGFRDVLEIGRFQRPAEGLYDFTVDNPAPLIPRYLRREIRERIDSRGQVVLPLDEVCARDTIKRLKKEGIQSIAVSLLFSFLNPLHEQMVKEMCQQELEGVYISLSSQIAPEFREYERTSTVVISAYLQPIVERYVQTLRDRLKQRYREVDLRLIQANGGIMTAEAIEGRAVYLVNSGPAGGATAAAFIGRLCKRDKLISIDMGGTSFDISLIEGGLTHVTTDAKFEGYPIKIPMNDVNIIGAGGGSIAWVDKGGALNVGPGSAGALPGPACYAKGGTEPTVTDANLLLGRISPGYFLGGEVPLYPELSERAIGERISRPLGISVQEAASGILKVVNANMSKAIAIKSIQKGHDLREFSLVAFGGAGPLHALQLAEELNIKEVIIPPYPGAFSAFGLLVADTRHDYVRTLMREEGSISPSELWEIFCELQRLGERELEREEIGPADRVFKWSCDLRFEGQSYELNIPVEPRERPDQGVIRQIIRDFNLAHERIYSFKAVDERCIFVNVRVAAIGVSPPVSLKRISQGGRDPGNGMKSRRSVYFDGLGFVESKIYERDLLKAGNLIEGPAVIEEAISCTLITPGRSAHIDEYGNIIIHLR